MKRTYVYDKKTGSMRLKGDVGSQRKGPVVWSDIEPYQTVGPEHGKWITSRSQHKSYLKRHNLIEVGNEKKYCGPESK